jgi:hypothetical protein
VLDADVVLIDVTSPAPTSAGDVYLHVRDLLAGGGWGVGAAEDGLLLLERTPDAPPLTLDDLPPAFLTFARAGPLQSDQAFAGGGPLRSDPALTRAGAPRLDLAFGRAGEPPAGVSEAGLAPASEALGLLDASLVPSPDGASEPDGPRGVLRTTWLVQRQPPPGARLQFALSLEDGQTAYAWDLADLWWYPPQRWTPGEIVSVDVPGVPLHQFRSWRPIEVGF